MIRAMLLILLLPLFYIENIYAQDSSLTTNQSLKLSPKYIFRIGVENGDTMLYGSLPAVRIRGTRTFKNPKDAERYNKLVRNVKKVYPYAKLAGELLNQYGAQLDTMQSEKERKKYLKQVEDQLKAKYTGVLSDFTITQGIILVKLIDRQTSRTSFEIVKEMRGGFSAFFWQQLALIFDNNLKAQYDPYGADKQIEEIVDMIENGEL